MNTNLTIQNGQLAKRCSNCGMIKPIEEYHFRVDSNTYRNNCRQCHMCAQSAYQQRLRGEVLAAYGKSCVCCGENTREFLAIDHINGGGSQHRKELNGTQALYRLLKKQGWPEGYQILCHNCNAAKAHYGICPHQARVELVS